jgi:SNF family Na+-dependent transporter
MIAHFMVSISFTPGIGFAMFFISVGIGLYYNVIIAWTLYYFGATIKSLFEDELPWTTCGNDWNTDGE